MDQSSQDFENFTIRYCLNENLTAQILACNFDEKFKKIWDDTPHLDANGLGPHYLQEIGLFNELTIEIKENIDSQIIPLYKLINHVDAKYEENSILYYLFNKTIQH